MDKAWKALERTAATKIGGEREHFAALDVSHPRLAIECKHRKSLGVWTWFRTLEKKTPAGKLPVLVLKEKGRHGELAVVRFDELLALLADAQGKC